MKTLTVVGAGISGSSAKLIAEELGWKVNLIDDRNHSAASRAALATIRPTWFDKSGRARAEMSWKFYEKWNAAICREAIVSSYRNPNIRKIQQDWWLVDPWIMLQEPNIKYKLESNEQTKCFLSDGSIIESDALLLATGSRDTSYKPLFGATLISKNAVMRDPHLRVHHLRPYHSMMVGSWNGITRLGSSISSDLQKAIDEVYKMLDVAVELEIVNPESTWELVTGARSKSKESNPTLPELGNKVGLINGLHRSGYAFAPDAINRWLNSL